MSKNKLIRTFMEFLHPVGRWQAPLISCPSRPNRIVCQVQLQGRYVHRQLEIFALLDTSYQIHKRTLYTINVVRNSESSSVSRCCDLLKNYNFIDAFAPSFTYLSLPPIWLGSPLCNRFSQENRRHIHGHGKELRGHTEHT